MTRSGWCHRAPFVLSLLLLVWLGDVGVGVGARPLSHESTQVVREVYLMGTRATLIVASDDRAAGLRQLEGMLEVRETTERELSTWRDDSLLSQLNRQVESRIYRRSIRR